MGSKIRALVTEARWRGLWGTMRAIRMNKMGTMHCFIGEDEFRNRYFENKSEWYGRDRWVEYADERDPDSLKVTPEWHAWLHHIIDTPPAERPLPKPSYQVESKGNMTGTRDAYVPPNYRLSKKYEGVAGDKFEQWSPHRGQKKGENEKDVLDLK